MHVFVVVVNVAGVKTNIKVQKSTYVHKREPNR